MSEPLYVSFIWHLHQPYYKDTETSQYGLPWVRLHAVKDYLHLAQVIGEFPRVHQTINVVPSLAEQIQEYATGTATDRALEISQKAAHLNSPLDDADKRFVLDSFFSINWDHFVLPEPRFAQLARLREASNGDPGVFSEAFWLDLIAWYNLAWIDPSYRNRQPRLRALVKKGRDFSREDVATILAVHLTMCGDVIPAYRELVELGLVELSTSPYFHPILPLLVDTTSAREASPHLPLPLVRFAAPDDAREQLALAMEYHERVFGNRPAGLWPSEGAVSQAAVDLIREQANIQWIATDEHVLERALGAMFGRDNYGHLLDPRPVYQPYRTRWGAPSIFFRDQTLADRIGFVYQHWNSKDGANDLVERLLHADRVLQSQPESGVPPIVSIVLDGENCWEFYPNNGDDFLRFLFERIGREDRLRAVTPSEYLTLLGHPEHSLRVLDTIPAASWIAGNLETWIGEPDQNRAWEYLAMARARLMTWDKSTKSQDPDRRRRAWHAMHVAEGSDWFWWYYSHNRVGGEDTFDAHYREHLANIYRAIEAPVPEWLARPIAGQQPQRERAVSGPLVSTGLSGDREAGTSWANAGFVDAESSTGSMQVGVRVFRRLYFGFDDESVYARIEFGSANRTGLLSLFLGSVSALAAEGTPPTTSSDQSSPPGVTADVTSATTQLASRVDLPDTSGGRPELFANVGPDNWSSQGPIGEVILAQSSAELKLPRSALRLATRDEVYVVAALRRGSELVESVPASGVARFVLDEVAHAQAGVAAAGT